MYVTEKIGDEYRNWIEGDNFNPSLYRKRKKLFYFTCIAKVGDKSESENLISCKSQCT